MKKLLILFVAIILSGTIAGSAVPIGLTIMGGDGVSGGEGGGCTTANDEALYSELVSDSSFQITAANAGIAGLWDPGATVTITGYKFWIQDDTQTEGSGMIVQIQTDAPSDPEPSGTPVDGTTSTEVGHASISNIAMDEVWFELATPKEIGTGTWWVCLLDSGSAGTWTIDREDSNVHGGTLNYGFHNGTNWGYNSTRDVKMEVWGCP